jgi:AraC-like DNA-binding protein
MALNTKWVIGSGAAAVLLAGGIYGGTALAQPASSSASASPSASTAASAKPAASSAGKPSARPGFDRQGFLQHLAQRLNVSVDQLKNAFKQAAHDSVTDALNAGRITQDQANQINQRIDSGQGVGPFGFKPGGPGHGPRGAFGPGPALNAAAQALNMQPGDLMSQLRQGKSLADIAKAQNVDLSKVTSAMTNAIKPQLDRAVANGRLTQQQENDILSRISSGQFAGPGRFGERPARSGAPSASPKPAASAAA